VQIMLYSFYVRSYLNLSCVTELWSIIKYRGATAPCCSQVISIAYCINRTLRYPKLSFHIFQNFRKRLKFPLLPLSRRPSRRPANISTSQTLLFSSKAKSLVADTLHLEVLASLRRCWRRRVEVHAPQRTTRDKRLQRWSSNLSLFQRASSR